MAREIVDGESRLDLPTEATNPVTMLAGQLLQLHTQLRKLDCVSPLCSAATIEPDVWQRSLVSDRSVRPRSLRR